MLVVFGAAAIYMGVDGRATVRDSLKQEQIIFGAADDPAVAKFAPQWADEQVTTGTQARAFAQVIHEHALEGSGGLTYAQMGRFVSADDPENPAGTSDEAAALKDEKGNPVSNSARNTWVTATALSTALNMSYMAEQMALFGIVVGIALLLSGIGFIVLALGGALRRRELAPVGEARADGAAARAARPARPSPRAPESEGGSGRPRRFSKEESWPTASTSSSVRRRSPRVKAATRSSTPRRASSSASTCSSRPSPTGSNPTKTTRSTSSSKARGVLEIDGETVELKEGQAVFVPAGAEHRFVGYEQLSVLVIFAKRTKPD